MLAGGQAERQTGMRLAGATVAEGERATTYWFGEPPAQNNRRLFWQLQFLCQIAPAHHFDMVLAYEPRQPSRWYLATVNSEHDLLSVIHDLDIRDKHQALIPNVMGVASPIIQLYSDDGTFNPLVIGNPNAPSEIRLVFPNEAGPEGRQLIPTLHELVQLVEGIVEDFRALANEAK